MTTDSSPKPIDILQSAIVPGNGQRLRLALLDVNALFRTSLARYLASEPDLEVAGICGSPREALELLRNSPVDLVLLDFPVGSESSIAFVSNAVQQGYFGRFLIMADSLDVSDAALALKLGVSGIFLKSDAPERLLQIIHLVAAGELWVDRSVIRLLAERVVQTPTVPRNATHALLDREQKVLLGILGGLSNRKIGENMNLSESSVKAIVQRLFARASVRTRSQLVRVALEGSLGAASLSPPGERTILNGERPQHPCAAVFTEMPAR